MRAFKEKNQRVPRMREKGLSGIKGAVYRGEWQSYGIRNWNDLLLHVFGEVNDPKYKYRGIKGLENVAKTLREFKKNNNKFPRTTDKEMKGIRKALYRGEWIDFGIRKWSDLITFIFNNEQWLLRLYNMVILSYSNIIFFLIPNLNLDFLNKTECFFQN